MNQQQEQRQLDEEALDYEAPQVTELRNAMFSAVFQLRDTYNRRELQGCDTTWETGDQWLRLVDMMLSFATRCMEEHRHVHEYSQETGFCWCGADGNA